MTFQHPHDGRHCPRPAEQPDAKLARLPAAAQAFVSDALASGRSVIRCGPPARGTSTLVRDWQG